MLLTFYHPHALGWSGRQYFRSKKLRVRHRTRLDFLQEARRENETRSRKKRPWACPFPHFLASHDSAFPQKATSNAIIYDILLNND